MKIDQIISSKDRPAQLDLLLRSSYKFFKDCEQIFILYNYSSNRFQEGYDKLIKKHKDVVFLKEIDYRAQFLELLLNAVSADHVLFNSDDGVFIRNVDLDKIDFDFKFFSLRLGKGLKRCIPAKLDMIEPEYIYDKNNIIGWDWTKGDKRVCYYYNHCYDSNIYNKEYIYNVIKNGNWLNPYSMENYMNANRDYNYNMIYSFDKSCLISNSINETGQGGNLIHGDQTCEYLNNKWLVNYQIVLDNFINKEYESCHIIQEIMLEKND